jgi:hypothetical protein
MPYTIPPIQIIWWALRSVPSEGFWKLRSPVADRSYIWWPKALTYTSSEGVASRYISLNPTHVPWILPYEYHGEVSWEGICVKKSWAVLIWRELGHMGAKSIDIRWPRHLSLYREKQDINNFKFGRKSINRVHKRIIHTYCNYRISRYAYLLVSRWINYPPETLLHVGDKIHPLEDVLERRRSTTY